MKEYIVLTDGQRKFLKWQSKLHLMNIAIGAIKGVEIAKHIRPDKKVSKADCKVIANECIVELVKELENVRTIIKDSYRSE